MKFGVALCLAGCIDAIPITSGAPCPCEAGFYCCLNACVPDGENCVVEGMCPLPPVDEMHIEIGVGSETLTVFEPLPDDGVLPLYAGPQGGYHVFIQVRLVGLQSDSITLTRRLLDPDDLTLIRSQEATLPFACPAGETKWILSQDQLTYICPSTAPGYSSHDRDLLLDVTARDQDDNVLPASAMIHPVCPEGDDTCTDSFTNGCAAPPE